MNNGAPSWPNRIGSGQLDNPTVDAWFNTADFVAPPQNTYGDSGRGILYAPGHVNSGLRLPQFGDWQRERGPHTTTIVDNRSMQFALKVNF